MRLGLTGGIGCGKSTAVAFFREAGWFTIESDAVVRDLLANDATVRVRVRSRWGDAVFSDDEINRNAVADRVFKDSAELKWLESLLHPLVRERWEAAMAKVPRAHCLVEIPLLFEKRLETRFDLTVCVASPPDVVENRMVARGYTGAEIARRRERQMSLKEKAERADYLISNAGSPEFLKRQITKLIEQVTAV